MKNRYDRLFFVILAGVILLLFLHQHFAGSKGSYILVTQNGEKIGEYSLLENQTFVVTDENHSYNTIVIENGQVWIDQADCPDKLCVKQGKISKNGQSIICIQHKLTILVQADSEQEYDAVEQ